MRMSARKPALAALALVLASFVPACKNGTEAPQGTAAVQGGQTMDVKKEAFGRLADGTAVDIYTLTNKAGIEARVMTYGAILVSLKLPDRTGVFADVNLGFDGLAGYLGTHPYFGAIIGRVRQPHRQGPVHARRRRVHPAREQQRQHSPRRASGASTRSSGRPSRSGARTASASSSPT